MILRFYAKADSLVPVPGQGIVHGAPLNYVGRKQQMGSVVNSLGKTVPQASYPATKEAFEVDSDSPNGRRLRLICWRDSDLWPADEKTASECQVKFTDVVFKDGFWIEKSTKVSQ
jgi:hypothetical protein